MLEHLQDHAVFREEHMAEIPKGGWLSNGLGGTGGEEYLLTKDDEPGQISSKTVMVYLLDKKAMGKEPLGIIMERRRSERDGNNAIGMLRLARKEFASTEEMARRIVISDYV